MSLHLVPSSGYGICKSCSIAYFGKRGGLTFLDEGGSILKPIPVSFTFVRGCLLRPNPRVLSLFGDSLVLGFHFFTLLRVFKISPYRTIPNSQRWFSEHHQSFPGGNFLNSHKYQLPIQGFLRTP